MKMVWLSLAIGAWATLTIALVSFTAGFAFTSGAAAWRHVERALRDYLVRRRVTKEINAAVDALCESTAHIRKETGHGSDHRH